MTWCVNTTHERGDYLAVPQQLSRVNVRFRGSTRLIIQPTSEVLRPSERGKTLPYGSVNAALA